MFQRIGAAAYKSNLINTLALGKLTGNPEKKFPSVHVAGTNGKGSSSHLIASVLQEAGYKTALYTSPHLKDFRERIKINGQLIPKKYVIEFVSEYKKYFEQIKPSFFEMTFALAMKYFADSEIDIAVVETGMGGRLDSTVTINPVLCIITNIGWDHMHFLGNTQEKIAVEKSGIIKNNIPVVIGESNKQTDSIFISNAKENNSDIMFAQHNYSLKKQIVAKNFSSQQIIISKNSNNEIYKFTLPLAGNYQVKNSITVLQSLEILNITGYKITKEEISKGFKNVVKNTGLKGRWEILSVKPLIICDTAHNINGIKEVVSQLKNISSNKLHFVLGMVNDKDIMNILAELPQNAQYYFCKPNVPRGLDVDILFHEAEKAGLHGKIYCSVADALDNAKCLCAKEDVIFVGGSTFVVAEIV